MAIPSMGIAVHFGTAIINPALLDVSLCDRAAKKQPARGEILQTLRHAVAVLELGEEVSIPRLSLPWSFGGLRCGVDVHR
jgi:hypothetical protein